MTKLDAQGKRPAIFFDIDGVLNEDPGPHGVLRPEDVVLIPNAAAAVAAARKAGFLTIGISNRAQVAHGKITLDDLDRILGRLQSLLAAGGATLDRIYFCPHHPEGNIPELSIACECRKPGALLFRRAIEELSIDRARSIAIGDSLRDVGAAHAASVRAYGLRTGYGCRDVDRYPGGSSAVPVPELMFDNVGEAVQFAISSRDSAAPMVEPSKLKPHADGSAPRLLYVVTEDWFFLSHRLPMARAARAAGFEVHVATNVDKGAPAIAREGFILHPVRFARGRLSPLASLLTILALRRVHREIAPDLVHRVAVQPTILGALAALGLGVASVNAITGLGYAFTSDSAKARLVRAVIGTLICVLLSRARSLALVQNPDDREMLSGLGMSKQRIVLIPGSGVDVEELQPLPEPAEPMTIAFVGRLLDDKGIRTLIAAHRLLRTRGAAVNLLIAGTPDPANPASVSQAEAEAWGREAGITWLGHVGDISTVWARAHIAVLPSRREGLPKTLLEAAACGRPMIATDVPGCREIAIHGETGLLVPVDDAEALAAAIEKLARASGLRADFGRKARRLVVERFAADVVGRAVVDLYSNLVAEAI